MHSFFQVVFMHAQLHTCYFINRPVRSFCSTLTGFNFVSRASDSDMLFTSVCLCSSSLFLTTYWLLLLDSLIMNALVEHKKSWELERAKKL